MTPATRRMFIQLVFVAAAVAGAAAGAAAYLDQRCEIGSIPLHDGSPPAATGVATPYRGPTLFEGAPFTDAAVMPEPPIPPAAR